MTQEYKISLLVCHSGDFISHAPLLINKEGTESQQSRAERYSSTNPNYIVISDMAEFRITFKNTAISILYRYIAQPYLDEVSGHH